MEIGEAHTFKASWRGETGWENCLLRLLREEYGRFAEWDAAVSGMRTILEIDRRIGEEPERRVEVPESGRIAIGSPLELDWETLRPRNRDYLFIHLNGWLLDTARFNDVRVSTLCERLGCERPEAIGSEHSLSLRELAGRLISLHGRAEWFPKLSVLESEVHHEPLELLRGRGGG